MARSRPTSSMEALMSATVTRAVPPEAACRRKAMSPVPPAMSRPRQGRAASRRGFILATMAAFQARCRPADIRSFIRS